MNRFAEIYGGKIRDVKETTLDYVDFVSLFSPKSYWIDATGVACEIGYVQEFKEGQGIVFVAPPSVTPTTEEEIIQMYTDIAQKHLDSTAKQRNYDGILSLCTYATSANPTFAKEGQAGVIWRDSVWAKCYAIMGEVKAGTRATPTTEEVIAELPLFTWGD